MTDLGNGYSLRWHPAEDSTVDPQYDVLLHGAETRWCIQVGDTGYFGVNEYGFDANGELEWMQDHGIYRSRSAAIKRLRALLKGEP